MTNPGGTHPPAVVTDDPDGILARILHAGGATVVPDPADAGTDPPALEGWDTLIYTVIGVAERPIEDLTHHNVTRDDLRIALAAARAGIAQAYALVEVGRQIEQLADQVDIAVAGLAVRADPVEPAEREDARRSISPGAAVLVLVLGLGAGLAALIVAVLAMAVAFIAA